MPEPNLTVHDIAIREDPEISPTGAISTVTRVTFFVADHGPFRLSYPPDQFNSVKVQSDIDAKVQQLREILTVAPSTTAT